MESTCSIIDAKLAKFNFAAQSTCLVSHSPWRMCSVLTLSLWYLEAKAEAQRLTSFYLDIMWKLSFADEVNMLSPYSFLQITSPCRMRGFGWRFWLKDQDICCSTNHCSAIIDPRIPIDEIKLKLKTIQDVMNRSRISRETSNGFHRRLISEICPHFNQLLEGMTGNPPALQEWMATTFNVSKPKI